MLQKGMLNFLEPIQDSRYRSKIQALCLVDFNAGKTQLVSFDQFNEIMMLGLSFSSKLNWGSYVISIAKSASNKIGTLIFSIKFLSSEVALYFYNLPNSLAENTNVWTGALTCYLEMLGKLQKQIGRNAVPSLAASLEPLAHCWNVGSS